ncbi:hypothetical protein TthTF19_23870 (plasmid) [Thermus thermophilus]
MSGQEAHDSGKEGGFPHPVPAENPHRFPRSDLEVHPAEYLPLTITCPKSSYFQKRWPGAGGGRRGESCVGFLVLPHIHLDHLRIPTYFIGKTLSQHLALVEHGDPVSEAIGKVQVVLD